MATKNNKLSTVYIKVFRLYVLCVCPCTVYAYIYFLYRMLSVAFDNLK